MNQTKSRELTGFFISFTEDEISIVNDFLVRNDYSPDGIGLKEFILDNVNGDEDDDEEQQLDTMIKKVSFFIQNNPQLVSQAGGITKILFEKILNRKKG